MEFKPFPKIERLNKTQMSITQKIHGSNAQVFIFQIWDTETPGQEPKMVGYDLKVGSRTRWITPEDDNFGFAKFVYENKQAFIDTLGAGQHFGEWAGPGINSGEGLTEKTFILFDHWKYPEGRPLPPRTKVVPVLYSGTFDLEMIRIVMNDLKENGSQLVPGFMRPEGVVIMSNGQRFKKVFEAEETAWTKGDGRKERLNGLAGMIDVTPLLQPVRMEKLLSRDEKYLVEYPASLPVICSDYIADLIAEGQITGTEDEIKVFKRALGSKLFAMAKEVALKAIG